MKKTPFVLKFNIYKFSCARCNLNHVGKTSRHLLIRICEHKSVSNLTNNLLVIMLFSTMHEHNTSCSKISPSRFMTIANENNDIELLVKESLLIKNRPTLNYNTAPLNCMYLIN